MNNQAFTNALRAITGDKREYPEHKQRDPMEEALEALHEFECALRFIGLMQSAKEYFQDKSPTELQARIEMRVNELRELITTGEIV